jgi:hypothetical protein
MQNAAKRGRIRLPFSLPPYVCRWLASSPPTSGPYLRHSRWQRFNPEICGEPQDLSSFARMAGPCVRLFLFGRRGSAQPPAAGQACVECAQRSENAALSGASHVTSALHQRRCPSMIATRKTAASSPQRRPAFCPWPPSTHISATSGIIPSEKVRPHLLTAAWLQICATR